MSARRCLSVAIALAALAAAAALAAPPRYTIALVPALPERNTALAALSEGIAGGSAKLRGAGGSSLGIELRGQHLRTLAAFDGATTTIVQAVNAGGAIAGLGTPPAGCCAHAFFARGPDAEPQGLFAPGADNQSWVAGLNDAGAMAGAVQQAPSEPMHAFVARPGAGVTLIPPLLAGQSGHATAINASGTVVGAMTVETTRPAAHAFAWNGGAPVELPMPGAWLADSEAKAINAQGWIVGYAQIPQTNGPAPTHAVMWRDGAIVDLGFDADTLATVAWGVNAAGVVVGARTRSDGSAHGWVWVDGAHADLDMLVDGLPAGVTVFDAVAVDEQGRIAVNLEDAAHWRRGRGAILTPVAGR